jgi:ATP-dependent DNA helicase RecQ
LYHEDDLNKHFNLLNQSRLNLKEIQQIWRAIKEKTKTRDLISQSALEIAKSAGWDESITDITTRVTTAIAALEDSGYIKRGQNSPRVFADSILVKSTIEAREKIQASDLIPEIDKENAVRIMQKLISTKYKSRGGDEVAESRIDYISDHLGIPKEEVIRIINNLRELKILSDDKDLTTIIKPNSKPQNALKILGTNIELLRFLASNIDEELKIFNLKKLNEEATNKGINCSLKNLKTIINYSTIAKIIESKKTDKDHMQISLLNNRDITLQNIEKLYTLSEIIIKYLHELSFNKANENKNSDYQSFSVLELKNVYEKRKSMLDGVCDIKEIENAIFFMQKIDILQVEGGFLVIYNPMSINRIVKDNLKQYTKADYEKLENFYKSKMQQIHIVGEYASKMLKDYQEALEFVDDYFQYEYKDFLNKYFIGNRKEEIERNMSPARFKKLFASLSPHQIKIINDKEHQRISVAAGPGSGKTKLLVHKLASILYTEDIRHEQLLMLTFSRAAVMEFKSRLRDLIQGAAAYIDIKTFHSYCFDILGRVGSVEKTDQVIREAIESIKNQEVDPSKVTKMVLVIDEAQDMNQEEYELIQELINYNENLRIIAVGDDDQNIFEFRGSNSQYFRQLSNDKDSFYELPINYRSKKSIVEFSNYFVEMISNRLKTIPIYSNSKEFGNIKVTRYLSKNLIIPVVNDVIGSKLDGTTCVITRTNEQALHITGLLKKLGKQVSLIQSNDDFNLYNLLELRNFCDLLRNKSSEIITKQVWDSCLEEFKVQNNSSINFDLCLEIISKFYDNDSRSIYLNDFFEFIYESNLSDFYEKADIVVSTFHKAKGKEFDNVFILYDNEFKLNDIEKRQLYVGLTRAKSFLSIHTNNIIFKNLPIKNYEYKIEEQEFGMPDRLVYQLSHRDVNLGYSKFVKNTIKNLTAGTKLEIDELPYLRVNGKRALQFSKAFYENIHGTLLKEYKITEAYARYLVYWTNKDDNSENLIILPELVFDYKTSEDNQEVIDSSSICQDINEVENIEIMEKEIEVNEIEKDNLRNALKEYRLDQAKVLKKPAFVVFSDKTLDDLIIRLPLTIEELYHVNGFGDNKINLYGESLVSIINKYVDKKYSI